VNQYIPINEFSIKSSLIRTLRLQLLKTQALKIIFPFWVTFEDFSEFDNFICESRIKQLDLDSPTDKYWRILILADFFQIEDLCSECIYSRIIPDINSTNCIKILKDTFNKLKTLKKYKENWVMLFVKTLNFAILNFENLTIHLINELPDFLFKEIITRIINELYKTHEILQITKSEITRNKAYLLLKCIELNADQKYDKLLIKLLNTTREDFISSGPDLSTNHIVQKNILKIQPVKNTKKPNSNSVCFEILNNSSNLSFFIDNSQQNEKDTGILTAKINIFTDNAQNLANIPLYDKYYNFLIKLNTALDYKKQTKSTIYQGISKSTTKLSKYIKPQIKKYIFESNFMLFPYKCEIYADKAYLAECTIIHNPSQVIPICKIPSGVNSLQIIVTEHKLYTILLNLAKYAFCNINALNEISLLTYQEISEITNSIKENLQNDGAAAHNLIEWINSNLLVIQIFFYF